MNHTFLSSTGIVTFKETPVHLAVYVLASSDDPLSLVPMPQLWITGPKGLHLGNFSEQILLALVMVLWFFSSRLTISNKWLPSKETEGRVFLEGALCSSKNQTMLSYFWEPNNLLRKTKDIFQIQRMSGTEYGLIEKRNGNSNWACILVGRVLSDMPVLIQ